MFCNHCKFYQLEEVTYEGVTQKVKLCVGGVGKKCPAETAMENDYEHEGDTARDKMLVAGLHPIEIQ